MIFFELDKKWMPKKNGTHSYTILASLIQHIIIYGHSNIFSLSIIKIS